MYTIKFGYPGGRYVWLEDLSKALWEREYKIDGCLPKNAIEFKVFNSSKILKDCTSTTGGSSIVSSFFKGLCEKNRILGTEFHPVTIRNQEQLSNQSQYYLMRSKCEAPELDRSNARFVAGNYPNPNVIKKCGAHLDWPVTQVDIVRPKGTTMLVINNRFRKILLESLPAIEGLTISPLNGLRGH